MNTPNRAQPPSVKRRESPRLGDAALISRELSRGRSKGKKRAKKSADHSYKPQSNQRGRASEAQLSQRPEAQFKIREKETPGGSERTRQSSRPQSWLLVGALLLFFGAQTWAAGSYYISDYPWDERFSWRMFSSVRNLKCSYQMWRGEPLPGQSGQPCPDQSGAQCSGPIKTREMAREHHMVWINLLKRGRLGVLDQLAAYECAQERSAGRVYFEMTCPDPEQPRQRQILVQSPQVNLCDRPHERGVVMWGGSGASSNAMLGGDR